MEKISIMDGIDAIRADEGLCSTVYILSDGVKKLMIDSGNGSIEFGFTPELVLLTHGHFDHTRGVKDGWKSCLKQKDWIFNEPFHVPKNARDYDFEKMGFGKFELEIIETPGHTPGSVCIFERKNRILFSGDTKFAEGGIGRTDFFAGDEDEMRKSLMKIRALPYRLLCPGHGEFEEG